MIDPRQIALALGIGDGALGFWAALDEAWPQTSHQRCWVHKTTNVLNTLPKSIQGKAKAELQEIQMAQTKSQADKTLDRFARDFGAKHPKAVEKPLQDRAALLAFYDFPAEHWVHIQTTNPIESSFATIRHRTTRTKNGVFRNTLLGLVFQSVLTAEQSWRKLGGFRLLPEVVRGVHFQDGIAVINPPGEAENNQQKLCRLIQISHTPDLTIAHLREKSSVKPIIGLILHLDEHHWRFPHFSQRPT